MRKWQTLPVDHNVLEVKEMAPIGLTRDPSFREAEQKEINIMG